LFASAHGAEDRAPRKLLEDEERRHERDNRPRDQAVVRVQQVDLPTLFCSGECRRSGEKKQSGGVEERAHRISEWKSVARTDGDSEKNRCEAKASELVRSGPCGPPRTTNFRTCPESRTRRRCRTAQRLR